MTAAAQSFLVHPLAVLVLAWGATALLLHTLQSCFRCHKLDLSSLAGTGLKLIQNATKERLHVCNSQLSRNAVLR